MKARLQCLLAVILATLALAPLARASAYDGQPRLVVVLVIDQFRGDYFARYRSQFGQGGFRMFLEQGANFTDCNYQYANTRTAPGHATLLTGAYSSGHGIGNNEWWDPASKAVVTSVQDANYKVVGPNGAGAERSGASPHNLLADTLGDELKLATGGKARVFAVALKDRAAILPAGYGGDAAYWIERKSGAFITSTYYLKELPAWVKAFDAERPQKYRDRQWKDATGKVLRDTARNEAAGAKSDFYDVVGVTPFANDYEFDFARELIRNEKLGSGPATDLLVISLSANDILGHAVGPESAQMEAMALAMDRQLADFFKFLGGQLGLANVWLALSADHGIAPMPSQAAALRMPAKNVEPEEFRHAANTELSRRLGRGKNLEFIPSLEWPIAHLSQEAFASAQMNEEQAEQAAGEELTRQAGLRSFYTRWQLARGQTPQDSMGRKYANSYTPYGGWYVMGVPAPFTVGALQITDHSTAYTYDTHVPLAFYGVPFQPGSYRDPVEPVDLAATLASLLGINAPTHSIGRVLTQALRTASHQPGER